jgi:GNAT superfamily N-acetyltransferase
MTWTVRPALVTDVDQWGELYRGYREFYRLAPSDEIVARVWSWIHDPARQTNALVAVDGDGTLGGLAHVRRFERPSAGATGLYLDDLFTRPGLRGAGIGRLLIEAASEMATAEGHSVLRWITAEDNATARRLYDSVAVATPWVTYDLAIDG